MEAMFFMDCFENRISLYQEVLEHAIAKHPEASSFVDRIGDILGDPDEIRVSNSDPRVVLYYQHRQEIYGGKGWWLWLNVWSSTSFRRFT